MEIDIICGSLFSLLSEAVDSFDFDFTSLLEYGAGVVFEKKMDC